MSIDGTSGADSLTGTQGADTINGLGGNDTLDGLDGSDVINGGGGADYLIAGGPSGAQQFIYWIDTLNGGGGDDTLEAGDLSSTYPNSNGGVFNGGAGVDTLKLNGGFYYEEYDPNNPSSSFKYHVGPSGGQTRSHQLSGIEIISFSYAYGPTTTFQLLLGSAAGDALSSTMGIEAFAYAGTGNDTVTGGALTDYLYGDGGDDTLGGGGSGDVLIGGTGVDAMTGGQGVDDFRFLTVADFSGGDRVLDFEIGDVLEFKMNGLVFIGTAAFAGNAGELRFFTSNGKTIVEIDEDGDAIADGSVTIENGAFSLRAFGDFQAVIEIAVIVPATVGDDFIRGSIAGETLNGLAGNDVLNGELGNDSLTGGLGHDTLIGGGGADTITGGTGADVIRWNNLHQLSAAGDVVLDLDIVDTLQLSGNLAPSGAAPVFATWIGTAPFSAQPGQYRYQKFPAQTQIQLDLDGDGVGDRFVTIANGAFDLWAEGLTIRRVSTPMATAGDDSLAGNLNNDSIDGAAGDDIILGAFGIDTLSGGVGADSLHGEAGVDKLDGGAGNDVLLGGRDYDTLIGGAGADYLDGGSDLDRVDYSAAAGGVFVSLATGLGSGDVAEGDTLIAIEFVFGGNFDDTLVGSEFLYDGLFGGAGDDNISGLAGYDTLVGDAGDDSLFGGSLNDALWGGADDDALSGEEGADKLSGGAGADLIEGGDGVDQADYSDAAGALTINLSTGIGSGDIAQGDKLSGVENVIGGNFSDRLIGSNAVGNMLEGGAGDDTIAGLSGADQLFGGAGVDTLDYSDATAKVVVRLWNGSVTGGSATGDYILGFENVIGGKTGDALAGADNVSNFMSGGTGHDTIQGLSGNDTLRGGPGGDNLNGGAGVDTLDYSDATGQVIVRLWNQTATGDIATGDTIAGFERVFGSAAGDAIVGSDNVANYLVGNGGADNMQGLSGDDYLVGGTGNDTLSGGTGNDRFEFASGFGIDRITDFVGGAGASDVIRLVGLGAAYDSFAEIMAVATQIGANAVITIGAATITLVGVNKTSLVADDFLFG